MTLFFGLGSVVMFLGVIFHHSPNYYLDYLPYWLAMGILFPVLFATLVLFVLWLFMIRDCYRKVRAGRRDLKRWLVALLFFQWLISARYYFRVYLS